VPIADKTTKALPQNIEEFNAIAGLAFAQLYKEFPVRIDISREAIADAMGVSSDLLPSGRSFSQIVTFTLSWLQDEGYISRLNATTTPELFRSASTDSTNSAQMSNSKC
jgi:hypothetical protein